MNERIQELMEQATVQVDPDDREWVFFKVDQAKFAQLIVKECIDCLKPLSRNHSMVGAAIDTIREHFGVE